MKEELIFSKSFLISTIQCTVILVHGWTKYAQLNRRSSLLCLTYHAISFCLVAQFLFTYDHPIFDYLAYAWQTTLLHAIVKIEILQIIIFSLGVQNRLILLIDALKTFQSSPSSSPENLSKFQKCILELVEVNQCQSRYFSFPLLFNLMHLYSSITINLYWLGSAVLGNLDATFVGRWMLHQVWAFCYIYMFLDPQTRQRSSFHALFSSFFLAGLIAK